MPSSSRYPQHLAAALPTAGVLTAGGAGRQVLGQLHGREHLDLLPAQLLRVERDGLLHRGQRHQLQQVVLDDVAGGADAVVVPGPATDPDVLGLGDLDVVDVVVVPDRLVQLVGEPQRQQVLDGLLAQVMVDPEHAVGRETRHSTNEFNSMADFRLCPNGFSITTRRHSSACGSHNPDRFSCLSTTGNAPGGIEK